MAKIRSGITGNLKGNIGSVNAGVIRSSGYVRKRWLAQAPVNSSSKQDRIDTFIEAANIWKFFTNPFLKFIWDHTYTAATGYHKFMKLNIPLIHGQLDDSYGVFEPFDGPLSPPTVTGAVIVAGIGVKVFYTSPQLITKQSNPTDTIIYMMWTQDKTIFSSGPVDRNRNDNSFTVAPELSVIETPIVIKVGFTPFRSGFNMSPTSKWLLPVAEDGG